MKILPRVTAFCRRSPGLVALGVRRVVSRLRTPARTRLVLSIVGVAVAVALVTVVTGLALGLASSATVQSEDVDYWIVPDDADARSVTLRSEGTRLGDVHEVTRQLRADDRIQYATPVLIQPLRIEDPDTDTGMYVLALGVIPPDGERRAGGRTVGNVPIGELNSTYPFYANGQYNGRWTGEAVVTQAVVDELAVSEGEVLRVGDSHRNLTAAETTERNLQATVGEVPAIVVPLAELQAITGTTEGDQADQILVATSDPAVRDDLASIYPETLVVSRSGISGIRTANSQLPQAMALASIIVAGGIGVLFVATMMGLELAATRREIAVLSAVGFSGWSQALIVVTETVSVALLGGVLGVCLGAGGIFAINEGVINVIPVDTVAVFTPELVPVGLLVAIAVGLLASPYPLVMARRTDVLEVLER